MRLHAVFTLSGLFGADGDVLRETRLQIILLATTVEPLAVAVLSPVLESLTGPFGVSMANVGLLMAAYTGPAIFVIPLAGFISDRYGRKPLLVGGLLLLGTGGLAIPFTTDFRVVLALRIVQGIGGAAIVPTLITLVGDSYDGTREAAAQGFRFMGTGLSQVLFPILAGALVVGSWRYPFLLYAVAFPAALVVFLFLSEPAPVSANGAGTSELSDDTNPTPSLRTLLGAHRLQAILVISTLPGMLWICFLSYNSIIVVEFMDGTPTQAGILAAVGSLAYAASAAQSGRITNYFDNRFYPLVGANLGLGVGFLIVLSGRTLPLLVGGVAVFGMGFGILLSIYRSIITGMAPTSLRGRVVSVAETGGRLSLTVAPGLMGILVTVTSPYLGFEHAVQFVGVGLSVVVTVGGILGLLLARAADPVPLAP